MSDIKTLHARWPEGWDKSFAALCSFYKIRAHADSHSTVLLMNSNGVPFSRVPTDITLKDLRVCIPLLVNSFEMGTINGENRIKSRIRDLIGKDPELNITGRNSLDHSHGG